MKRLNCCAAICCLIVLVASCGENAVIDLGSLQSASATPRIIAMRYLGQSPKSAEILIFEIDFDDADGDLANGTIRAFVNGESIEAAKLPLRQVFLQNELNPKSTSGMLRFPIAIFIDEASLRSQGTSFRVGVQLIDSSDHKSNLAQANLSISQ